MRVDTLTPVLDAAPGEFVMGRVRVVNDGADDATFTLRVVGLDGQGVVYEVPGGPVGPGLSAEVDVPLEVPPALGVGQHAVALEVSSDRSDERPALARLTVSIDSLERVQLSPRPSTVRAGRNGRFTLDVLNNEFTTVDVVLGGEAPDVAVVFDPPMVRLHPGERGWVRGKIRAKQRWGGDSLHHVLTLTARGRSSTTSTTMAYIQRPVVPGKARNAVAAFVVFAIFLGAIVGGLWWWNQRDTTETATTPDGQLGQLDGVTTGADGSTGADGTAGGNGTGPGGAGPGADGGGADGGADAPSGPGAIPTFTVVTGTVSTSAGSPAGVTVRLAPIDLGGQIDDDATIVGVAGASRGPAKIWSARYAVRPSVLTPVRQTESVLPISTDGDGVWRFVDIPIRQNYELVFSKAGYNTQSFVVTPPADGSRVELDVELEAATGQLSGVVVGPEGALGGVAIVVTDGDLTFRTTSATEASGTGQVGSFAIEGLSTPAVYTLSATLRGYGTEVVQLPFAAGQERSGTTVSMQAGVGSISGRVSTGGEPRGGVTITASNGDDTFTTTSLTEGDVGAYSIPRLDIPGDYTITATLPGFISDTRRVDLDGNAVAVDFGLVSTTAGISGRVFSDNGEPLVGAGITVSVDDVGFRSATAAAPVAGSFNIDDLPPGTYLVRIARFDHLPFAQQVTVGAGQRVDLGEITLEFSARPPIAALGSIAVRVFDSEDSDLEGATVSIYRLLDRVGLDEPIASITDEADEQSNFVFENIPIGSYRVRVTRPIYRTVERRASVGLGREDVEVRMLRLGQASGQIVTSDDQPLRDYVLRISRLEPSGVLTFIEDITVVGSAVPDEEGAILWESAPNSLVTGTYRIEVVNQPPGYVVEPNQVLDDTVTQTPASMLFRVPPDSDEPVRVSDIVADPLPLIGGRFFVPRYDPATRVTTMVELQPNELEQVTGLAATLVCVVDDTEIDVTAAIPPNPVRDQVQPFPGFQLPTLASQFEITPFALQDAGASGSCRLDVVSDDFVDVTVPLASDIVPTPGSAVPQQRAVNVALLRDARPFFGNVFWRDRGAPVPLPGVRISSDANMVLGATARQGDSIDATNPPQIDRGSLSTESSTESDTLGAWDLTGQRFGAAVYTFDADDFSPGTLRVVYDDAADPTVPATRTITDLGGLTSTVRSADDGVDVELTSPEPGPLTGEVTILTTRPEARFDAVGRRANGPGSEEIDPLPYSGPATGGTTVPWVRPIAASESVAAGTWEVTFGAPGNHDFFDGAPTSVQRRVQPSSGASGFDTSFVELGLIDIGVTYAPTLGAAEPNVAPTITLRRDSAVVPPSSSATGSAKYERVEVHPTTPLATAVTYNVETARPGYDETAARTVVTDQTDPDNQFTADDVSDAPSTAVDLGVLAGTDLQVTVTLPQYGTITGTVLGRGFTDEVLQIEDGDLEVTALPVVGDVVQVDPDSRVSYSKSGDEKTSFVVTAPPGTYQITVSDPFFEPTPVNVPVDPAPGSVPGRFANENTVPSTVVDPWVLAAKRSTLEVSVLGSFDSDLVRVPIENARVTISRPDDPGFTPRVVPSGADGAAVVDELLPGTYRLEVRRLEYVAPVVCPDPLDPAAPCTPVDESWTDLAYPFIADLVVSSGSTAEELKISVEVKLPSLTGNIRGTVLAVNSNNVDIDDPQSANQVVPPDGVIVTRSYTGPPLQINPDGTIDNTATDLDVTPPLAVSQLAEPPEGSTPEALSRVFGFLDVPGGDHELSFALADGRTPDGYVLDDNPRVIAVDDTDDPDTTDIEVVYRAIDVSLVVELAYGGGTPSNPEVTLDDGTTTVAGVRDGTTFTFAGVPPRQTAYQVTVTDDLSRSEPAGPTAIVVVPNGDGSGTTEVPRQLETITMVGSKASITGAVQQYDQPSPAIDLEGPAAIVLRRQGAEVARITLTQGQKLNSYSFTADKGGAHTVEIEKAKYQTDRSAPFSVNLGGGVTGPTVTALRLPRATIEISDATSDDDTTVVAFKTTAPSVDIDGTRTDKNWEFLLDLGADYGFRASRPGHYDVAFPTTDTVEDFNRDIGDTVSYSSGMIRRELKVQVSGPSTGDFDVAVSVGSANISRDDVDVDGSPPTEVLFTSTDPEPLPLTGGGTVTVSADGFRPQSATIDNVESASVAPSTAQSARTQTISMTLRPVVTSVTGTLTGTTEEVEVTLTGPGTWPPVNSSFDEDANTNTYSFEGAFPAGNYTVSVAELGVGAGSATFSITADSPSTATKDDVDLDVAARDVTVTLTDAPESATVFAGTTQLTLTETDPVQFERSERLVAATYQVRNAGSVWLDVVVALSNIEVDDETGALTVARLVALPDFPTFGGTVTVAVPDEADDPAPEAVVSLAQGACPISGTTVIANSSGVYTGLTLSAGGPEGDYCISATFDGRSVSKTINIPDDSTTQDLTVPAPPPPEDDP